ncbi:MAG TPA: hypothetical protein VD794_07095 [Flavisolibacter sp.]|nr:hypothetical protein [Flavisolibacter sp.]
MRDRLKYYPVNWIDGMKINKDHFIAQDHAVKNALHDTAALSLSPQRYGLLPPTAQGENTFRAKISLDNQNTLRVVVEACQAMTPGGIRIALPSFAANTPTENDYMPSIIFPFTSTEVELDWWIVLVVNPFETQPAGSPDLSEVPPRFPFVLPTYSIQVVSTSQYKQFALHPYALTIGKLFIYGGEIRIVDYYIPPCISVSAHPDLVSLHGEFDQFMASLERHCVQIVQKIFKKSQQNDISELVMFLCDRILLYVSQALSALRLVGMHQAPADLFLTIATLARVIKNTIDLRIGSGRDELMNYLSEWCDLKQGELDAMLNSIANMTYEHNDVNKNISEVAVFAKVVTKLFATLSKLDFIGKRKEAGIFVKEEQGEARRESKHRFLG